MRSTRKYEIHVFISKTLKILHETSRRIVRIGSVNILNIHVPTHLAPPSIPTWNVNEKQINIHPILKHRSVRTWRIQKCIPSLISRNRGPQLHSNTLHTAHYAIRVSNLVRDPTIEMTIKIDLRPGKKYSRCNNTRTNASHAYNAEFITSCQKNTVTL